ncbi:4'-phosphopantetheinyl transferase [Fistulina hepatica ATCC 64428]|uniref:4'-phosphopantetheinyl transferase n=1 Tax=Fistulina hepatica ATCC 64428 TaxID=1128425 RepID=A0A0D7ADR0_9AGAR|nr:4'-phosphopantetheinyl transferase [Fistulina hepatica ATCC 64428]
MAIIGIGVDVLHVPRLAAVYSRHFHRFPSRILSKHELSVFERLPADAQQRLHFLGVRWAVKEAAYKALCPMFRATWKDLTYSSLQVDGMKPALFFVPGEICDTSVSKLSSLSLHVSVSHDGAYVFANVIAKER